MSIEIQGVSQEVTAYKKYIDFTYEDKTYGVVLYWDAHDGYELWFRSESSTPEWALNWEDNYPEDGLCAILDSLSDKKLEGESE